MRRQAQAKETRSAIVGAAPDLFIEQGYGRTTMADVARAAGASVETIYAAFGNKATLLHKAWDITVGGDDEDIVFHERPEVRAIRGEPDLARRLMLQAVFSTKTAQRIAPFQLMVQAAARPRVDDEGKAAERARHPQSVAHRVQGAQSAEPGAPPAPAPTGAPRPSGTSRPPPSGPPCRPAPTC